MGTNYYARYNECKHCKRYDEIHIGKSSAGWKFGFFANDDIKSYRGWIEFLKVKKARIVDDYEVEFTLKEFMNMVANKQKPIHDSHAEIYKEGDSFIDDEGYSMSPYEFS